MIAAIWNAFVALFTVVAIGGLVWCVANVIEAQRVRRLQARSNEPWIRVRVKPVARSRPRGLRLVVSNRRRAS